MAYGMTDTIGYKAAKAINENVTNSLIDDLVNQYAWYKVNGEYGSIDVKQVNNTCCLGYEDIFGNKYDMMDNVDLPMIVVMLASGVYGCQMEAQEWSRVRLTAEIG